MEAEVQNDVMHDRGSGRRDGRSKQRVKRDQQQANFDDTSGDAHKQRCVPGRDQVLHSVRGVDSLFFDARVTAETQQVQFSNKLTSWTRLLGSPAATVHRQELRAIRG